MTLDAGTLKYIGDWSGRLAHELKLETPLKMHRGGGQYASDGSPQWTAEFERWIERTWSDSQVADRRGPYQNSPERIRATRALRKLKSAAPAEFNVCWDATRLNPIKPGDDIPTAIRGITRRLNERAVRRGFPERYAPRDVEVLLFSGIDKLLRWK